MSIWVEFRNHYSMFYSFMYQIKMLIHLCFFNVVNGHALSSVKVKATDKASWFGGPDCIWLTTRTLHWSAWRERRPRELYENSC